MTSQRSQESDESGLLLDLAAALHLVSLPAEQVDLRVKQAARGLGLDARSFTLQSYASVQLVGAHPWARFRRMPSSPHYQMGLLASLVSLNDEIAQGRLDAPSARSRLDALLATPPRFSQGWIVLCYGLYSVAVAARIGGSVRELGAAAVVGLSAGAIHYGTASRRVDLQKTFLAALAGTAVALLLARIIPGLDLSRTLFAGITLLVPAMVVTIATAEMVSGSVEAGTPRFFYGVLRFIMIAAGVSGTTALWQLLWPLPPAVEASPLPVTWVFLLVTMGGVVLVAVMQAGRGAFPWIMLGVLTAWGTQETTRWVFGGDGNPFLSAFILATVGLRLAGRGHPAALVIIPGLLQLAPGFLGTRTMLGVLTHATDASMFQVFLVALQLVLGMVVAESLFSPRTMGLPQR